jgi:hypothetical protein
MTVRSRFETFRFSAIVISLTIGSGVFWAFLLAEGIRYAFKLDENKTIIFFGIPFLVLYSIWCSMALPGMLRKSGYIK